MGTTNTMYRAHRGHRGHRGHRDSAEGGVTAKRYTDGMSEAPKSAFELAMEKLKKKDAEAGVEQTTLTEAQRTAIAEAKSVYEARAAERRIMHQSAVLGVFDPAEREERDTELRRDLDRFATDRDAKIAKIRSGQ
jgi:hypothetical protein